MNLDKYAVADPVRWCEKNVTLDYGKFKRENHPLLIEPLRAAANMRGGVVGLIGSVQHIKTLTSQLWQLYSAQVEPTRAAMYDLTEQALKEFSDDKWTPLIDSTDAITGLIPKAAYRRTKFYTSMPYGSIRLLSANVLAARNSKTLERVSCDEAWAYKSEEDWLRQIRDRMTSYPWSWQMFLPSSGQTAGSELDGYWARSTQKVWHQPCECCGGMFSYIWTPKQHGDVIPVGGMRWAPKEEWIDEGGTINYSILRESVYYECQLCGGKIYPDMGKQHKRNLSGGYVSQNLNGDPKLDFYNYNAMAHFPWPDLVEEFINANIERNRGKLSGLENFIRKRQAETWSEAAYVSGDAHVDGAGDYRLGENWNVDSELFIFCTVDVQKDHFYYVIRAWTIDRGVLKSRLLGKRKVMTVSEIADACDFWNIPQGGLDDSVGCRVALDGNYNTNQVQKTAAQMGWLVFRGDTAKDYRHPDKARRMYSDIQYIDVGEGTVEGGQRYVGQFAFSNLQARNRLSLIRSIKDHKGEHVWTYDKEPDPVYVRQINAWAKISRENSDGSTYFDWINRDPNNDHYFDCEKMQLVFAAMAGLISTDSSENTQS